MDETSNRWIVTKNENYFRNTCPFCGNHIDADDTCISDTYSYCPFCGKKMQEISNQKNGVIEQ